jgi:hypothetical protein
MPRAKGTISLQQCVKKIHLNEPFAHPYYTTFSTAQWQLLVENMNNEDSCSKIHAYNLYNYRPSVEWYKSVLGIASHEIFVIERRDRLNQLLSGILALHHGYTSSSMKRIDKITIDETLIDRAYFIIEQHLKYYPTYGKVVSFETLPTEFFNKELKTGLEDQKSYLRHNCIINIEWCKDALGIVLDFYKKDWDNKILSLDPTWEF